MSTCPGSWRPSAAPRRSGVIRRSATEEGAGYAVALFGPPPEYDPCQGLSSASTACDSATGQVSAGSAASTDASTGSL